MAGRATPVMQQFAAAKEAHPDSILFFRMGDFYEMFEDDAVLCAKLLDLTLTSRNKGKADEIPMAGVPHHAAKSYVSRLLGMGHKVAICEQMADPSTVKGIVPREVVRVLTPALVTEQEHLEAGQNNWLAAIDIAIAGVGVALLDLSTGEFMAAQLADVDSALSELARMSPREVLVGSSEIAAEAAVRSVQALDLFLPTSSGGSDAPVRQDAPLGEDETGTTLGTLTSDADALGPAAQRAAARALRFARVCNPRAELPIPRITEWEPTSQLILDETTQTHLELVRSMTGDRKASLLGIIDVTSTAPGARLLRRRLLAPLMDVDRIRRRHQGVAVFVERALLRERLRSCLSKMADLERLATRAVLGDATPRDLGAIRDGLRTARESVTILGEIESSAERELIGIAEPPDTLDELAETLARALVERPPAQAKESGIFLAGFDEQLDELDELRKHGSERITALEAQLREEESIPNLRVRYTRVFGWYVEVSRSHKGDVPDDWRRKQTVAAGERYTMPVLDDLAHQIESAQERHRERELELLRETVALVADAGERIRELARRVARWDVNATLAEVAHRHDYVQPVVEASGEFCVKAGRHPVVEQLAAQGRFVPNDVTLSCDDVRLHLVTGPNMAGKSTLLRQVALITILAQMGSFVPAESASLGVVDRVLSRVGASDNVARGESTFMVEMRETASILKHATRRSLVILDEIGRGTSTFDGLAIAWAVAEYLDDAIGCRALFATHYHELTQLAAKSKHVANFSVSARELDDEIVFLHRVVPGAASRSYGVQVARLAGLPEPVLARARMLLEVLEAGQGKTPAPPAVEPVTGSGAGSGAEESSGEAAPVVAPGQGQGPWNKPGQLAMFADAPAEPFSEEAAEALQLLRACDVDNTTPMQALRMLVRLKKKL